MFITYVLSWMLTPGASMKADAQNGPMCFASRLTNRVRRYFSVIPPPSARGAS